MAYKKGEKVQLLDDGYEPYPGVTGVVIEGPDKEPGKGMVYKVNVGGEVRTINESVLATAANNFRFKVCDRVMTKEGVGTVVEIREFWLRAGLYPEPTKTPFHVLRDNWPHAPARYGEEDLTPATPEEDVVSKTVPWREDLCPRCGNRDLKKLTRVDHDGIRCERCLFLYEPSPWKETIKAPAKKSKAKRAGK